MLRSGTIAVCMATLSLVMATTLLAASPYTARQVHYERSGCGCTHHAAPVPLASAGGCCSSQRCCLPLIPQLLRSVDCLLQRVFCCSTCGVRCLGGRIVPSCGCDASVGGPVVVEEIVLESPRFVPTPIRSEGHLAPPHQRAAPKLRETQLKGHSIIKRTTYQKEYSGVPPRLSKVTKRPAQHVRRVATGELRLLAPNTSAVPYNPLRD
jgi:hypothetical protein